MRRVSEPSAFTLKLLIWISLLMIGISSLSYNLLLAIIITGLAIAHGVELQHQTIHNKGFRKSQHNKIAGLLLGFPMFVSYKEYQLNHIHHHRHLGTPNDQQQFDYSTFSVGSFIASVLLARNLKRFVLDALNIAEPHNVATTGHRAVIRKEKRIVGLLHIIVIGILVYEYKETGILYYVGSIVFASICHYLIELPEHLGCNRDSTCVFDNTRSITSNALMTWFVNANNLHVEHHYRSGLTPEQCKLLHIELRNKCKHLEKGYISFYSRIAKIFIREYILVNKSQVSDD